MQKTHPWTKRNKFEDTFDGEQQGEDHVEVTQNIFEKQWRSMKLKCNFDFRYFKWSKT